MNLAHPSAAADFGNRRQPAFTIIELLVVVAIIGLLAVVGLPALKGFGKSNAVSAADRQMLDEIGAARQRAIAEHTDVYVLFVSPAIRNNFDWTQPLTLAEKQQVSNVLNQQFSGYTLYVKRTVGDQPGQSNGRYLTSWRSLPDGIFIKTNKFHLADQMSASAAIYPDAISPFQTNSFPFPTATNRLTTFAYLQFNHLGQLVAPQDDGGEYIPLARGSIFYDTNLNADFLETPPGNSSLSNNGTLNTMFNRVRIDGLTGRARIEHFEMP